MLYGWQLVEVLNTTKRRTKTNQDHSLVVT